jgi:aromatic-L-amino-acid decarboxylase
MEDDEQKGHFDPDLHLSDDSLARAGNLLAAFLRDFERSIEQRRVVPRLDRGQLSELFSEPFPETSSDVEALFREIETIIVPNSTTTAHPRFLAYVLGTPNGIAPYAEAVAAALNQNCNFWQLSPAASVIERKVIQWLGGLFGYPETAGGILTSGGSMATLMALSAALHAKAPIDIRRAGLSALNSPLVIYTSEEAHRCVEKSAATLGIGLENVRKINVDADFRMRVDALERAIEDDRTAGKTPFCVVATAGTVNTGAIDPLDRVADFCAREGLWFHVDGAYGALLVLAESMRNSLRPCGRADSIALDPHKLLFAPLEAGCLLVRDRESLRKAFHFPSSYLTVEDDLLMTNFLEYGPQLSRSFKAFKIWCALKLFGIGAFRAAHERMLRLAQYMAARIESEPRMELMAPVTLTAVCFRLRGADSRVLLSKLEEDGAALLGPVVIHGQLGMRACIASYRTSQRDIDIVIERLLTLAA